MRSKSTDEKRKERVPVYHRALMKEVASLAKRIASLEKKINKFAAKKSAKKKGE